MLYFCQIKNRFYWREHFHFLLCVECWYMIVSIKILEFKNWFFRPQYFWPSATFICFRSMFSAKSNLTLELMTHWQSQKKTFLHAHWEIFQIWLLWLKWLSLWTFHVSTGWMLKASNIVHTDTERTRISKIFVKSVVVTYDRFCLPFTFKSDIFTSWLEIRC